MDIYSEWNALLAQAEAFGPNPGEFGELLPSPFESLQQAELSGDGSVSESMAGALHEASMTVSIRLAMLAMDGVDGDADDSGGSAEAMEWFCVRAWKLALENDHLAPVLWASLLDHAVRIDRDPFANEQPPSPSFFVDMARRLADSARVIASVTQGSTELTQVGFPVLIEAAVAYYSWRDDAAAAREFVRLLNAESDGRTVPRTGSSANSLAQDKCESVRAILSECVWLAPGTLDFWPGYGPEDEEE